MEVAQDSGLTVSTAKTKVMVCGQQVVPSDEVPFYTDGNNCIELVKEFQYLGSMVDRSGRANLDIERRVMQEASMAFGCLCKAVFKDNHLTVETKRNVYQAFVVPVLLYGSDS